MLRLARTPDEAHVYMDLHPCECGNPGFERAQALEEQDGELVTVYRGTCVGCGASRELRFRLPDWPLAAGGRLRYGGDQPSELLDPGEWIALADVHASRTPASRRDLAIAVAAVEEVLKFVPEHGDGVPPDRFVSARGRAEYEREPGRFGADRLEAVLAAYRELSAGTSG